MKTGKVCRKPPKTRRSSLPLALGGKLRLILNPLITSPLLSGTKMVMIGRVRQKQDCMRQIDLDPTLCFQHIQSLLVQWAFPNLSLLDELNSIIVSSSDVEVQSAPQNKRHLWHRESARTQQPETRNSGHVASHYCTWCRFMVRHQGATQPLSG